MQFIDAMWHQAARSLRNSGAPKTHKWDIDHSEGAEGKEVYLTMKCLSFLYWAFTVRSLSLSPLFSLHSTERWHSTVSVLKTAHQIARWERRRQHLKVLNWKERSELWKTLQWLRSLLRRCQQWKEVLCSACVCSFYSAPGAGCNPLLCAHTCTLIYSLLNLIILRGAFGKAVDNSEGKKYT